MHYDILKIKITGKCNRNCAFCVFHAADCEMDKETYLRFLDKSTAIDFDSFHINGGEPMLHKDFTDICKITREKFFKKKLVLGTNAILFENKKMRDVVLETFNEICIGCDDEHNNISYIKKWLPEMIANSNILFIINSLNGYTSDEIFEDLENLRSQYPERIILVRNDVHHLEEGYSPHKLTGLCKQNNKQVIMVDELGNVYRCFNSKVPDDVEFNFFDEDAIEKLNTPRDFHYKYCPFCPLYFPVV